MNQAKFKNINKHLTKGLLDLIILGMLKNKSMHGYAMISKIRKDFGVYFGPSTIYPFLQTIEEKGYIKKQWDMNHDRPRKVYSLTPKGNDILKGTEHSFKTVCLKLNHMGINSFSRTFSNQQRNGAPTLSL